MADVTYYVAMPFLQDDSGSPVAGAAEECQSPNTAMRRAEMMSRMAGSIGAVAFSRSGDPMIGEFGDAHLLRKFGNVPDDLSGLYIPALTRFPTQISLRNRASLIVCEPVSTYGSSPRACFARKRHREPPPLALACSRKLVPPLRLAHIHRAVSLPPARGRLPSGTSRIATPADAPAVDRAAAEDESRVDRSPLPARPPWPWRRSR